jgi:epoxyqueuosine reductase
VVDARRCIAYHSIENRDVVPVPLRRGFAGRVFGCDVCADVCPFNAGRGVESAAEGAAGEAPPTLRPLAALTAAAVAALTRAEFDRLAAGTPLARAQYDGLRRNALLALGSAREQAARPLVAALSLGDASAVVRDAATWALGQIDRTAETAPAEERPAQHQHQHQHDDGDDDGPSDGPALPS